eukprot:12899965-Prorocentrum_lima.AAC.1
MELVHEAIERRGSPSCASNRRTTDLSSPGPFGQTMGTQSPCSAEYVHAPQRGGRASDPPQNIHGIM